jgi:hypothetical protein
MMIGPPIVVLPKGHSRPVLMKNVCSYNSIGVVVWSDGVAVGPHLPKDQPIMKNPENAELFWVHECKELGNSLDLEDDEYGELEVAVAPTEKELMESLDTSLAESDQKKWQLRMLLWRRANDHIREDPEYIWTSEQKSNVEEFIRLSDSDKPNQRLLMIEACRELGRFRDAELLLEMGPPDDLVEVYDVLKKLVDSRIQKLVSLDEV